MRTSALPATATPAASRRLGDHVALDFLNTAFRREGWLHDELVDNDSVVRWLRDMGLLKDEVRPPRMHESELRHAAFLLRLTLRALVEQQVARDRGEDVDVDLRPLNKFLRSGRQQVQLAKDDRRRVHLQASFGHATAADLLMPVALAAAEMLAAHDPALPLVRRCEGADCTFFFYDRTKAHRRRWCSMATCGNRHKAASFRERLRR